MLITPRLFLRAGGWMSLFLLAISYIVLATSLREAYDTRLLARSGVTIEAQITNRETTPKSRGNSAWYFIDYTFSPAGDSMITRRHQEVSQGLFAALQDRETLTIKYLPTAPNTSRPNDENLSHSSWTGKLAGLICGLVGLWLGIRAVGLAAQAALGRRTILKVVDGIVTQRAARLISGLQFTPLPQGEHPSYTSFPRFYWSHARAHMGTSIRVVLTKNGAWLLHDLALPKDFTVEGND